MRQLKTLLYLEDTYLKEPSEIPTNDIQEFALLRTLFEPSISPS